MIHIPVLQKEIIEYLAPKPNENFIDCTIGSGGHALSILEATEPNGRLLGIDWDTENICNLKLEIQSPKIKKRLILVNDNFVNLKEIVRRERFKPVSGILFDLGMSSWHLEKSGRGFSFLKNEPLDMRYNLQSPLTAEKIVNYWSEPEIERILRECGEERFSKKIAKEIIKERKGIAIKTTSRLVEIIGRAISHRYQKNPRRRTFGSLRGRHFATRTFQAIRIAVNDELNNLRKTLPQTIEILKPEGKVVVISFHSLEDRIVKNFFRDRASITEFPFMGTKVEKRTKFSLTYGGEGEEEDKVLFANQTLKILTKKPVGPTKKEIKINPRSRSSKLRAAQKP